MAQTPDLKEKVHKRLRIRIIIYFVISLILIGVSIFHMAKDNASVLLSTVGFLAGNLIGLIVSRMFKISWDHSAEQVISTFDVIGIIVLLGYVAFEIFRTRIVEYFVHGPSVIAVSFAVFAGLMYGRVLGIRGKIISVFREQGLIG